MWLGVDKHEKQSNRFFSLWHSFMKLKVSFYMCCAIVIGFPTTRSVHNNVVHQQSILRALSAGVTDLHHFTMSLKTGCTNGCIAIGNLINFLHILVQCTMYIIYRFNKDLGKVDNYRVKK